MNIKEKLYKIVFETDTTAGKRFDVLLLWLILISVFVVMMESVPQLEVRYGSMFYNIEWIFTAIFTLEYFTRILISKKPFKYIFSFWGIIDLLSILPSYLTLIFTGHHYLLTMRIFRLLRVFRIMKLARFTRESQVLIRALKASSYKISIFLFAVLAVVTLMGTLMYVVEGGEEGFTSIPQSIYWAIVTVTTVGYGDMVPHTILGKIISSICMLTGYAIIAVPTGIVTVAMTQAGLHEKICENCTHRNDNLSKFCSQCGSKL